MKKVYKKNNLSDLGKKASKRKSNPKYRHIPSNTDILIANENAKLLETEQYKTF
jgi:hypothetical protein